MRPARPAHIAVALMMARLLDGPATVREIAEETGLTEFSTRCYVRAMRARRVVYVASWELDTAGRQTLAAYKLGKRPDAVRIPPLTRAQMARNYRARKRDAQLLGIAA